MLFISTGFCLFVVPNWHLKSNFNVFNEEKMQLQKYLSTYLCVICWILYTMSIFTFYFTYFLMETPPTSKALSCYHLQQQPEII